MTMSHDPSRQQKTDQKRAAYAWQCIEEVVKKSDAVKKKYHTYARQFGSLVQINGLLPTISFLYAKSKPYEASTSDEKPEAIATRLFLTHIRTLLAPALPLEAHHDTGLMIKTLIQESSFKHRQLTVELLAFARWLSRFAEAELPSEEGSLTSKPNKE